MLPGIQLGVVETESASSLGNSVESKKLSVCHVVSGDRWAGAEVQLAALIRALARKEELRVCVIMLNEGRLAEEVRRCGAEVKVIPESHWSFAQIFSEAARYLRHRDIRILHSHRYKENLLAALLAWRCKIPLVVRTQHGLAEPFKGLKRYKQSVIQLLDRIVARYATDAVISVSAELRDQLTRYLHPEKVITIHSGINKEQVRSKLTMADAKKRLGIPEDCWVLGTAGRLEPIKRLDMFLAAAHQIATQAPNTRFLIVGEGSDEARLREFVRKSRLDDRVLFLGHRRDIYDVLRAFDILILCSDHEGLPMVLLEVLCLGVPVVARRAGGISEVIQHDVNGVLMNSDQPSELADACLCLLRDEARRQRVARAGAQLVAEKYPVERTAAGVTRLYCSLAGIR